jgi:hypothetical protein
MPYILCSGSEWVIGLQGVIFSCAKINIKHAFIQRKNQ